MLSCTCVFHTPQSLLRHLKAGDCGYSSIQVREKGKGWWGGEGVVGRGRDGREGKGW